MEKIVIEVDDATASKWNRISRANQLKISALVKKTVDMAPPSDQPVRPTEPKLQEIRKDKLALIPDFEVFINTIQAEAAANGLTEDLLDRILAEND